VKIKWKEEIFSKKKMKGYNKKVKNSALGFRIL